MGGRAAALKNAINRRLWVPKKGYYAYFLDADGSLEERIGGGTVAILHGVADARKTRSILKKTPTAPAGFPCLWPPFPERAVDPKSHSERSRTALSSRRRLTSG